MWRLWLALGEEDIVDRYRRTFLGALWIGTSFALFVAVKVTIFGQMISTSTAEFGLYVTVGFGLWSYISSMVQDACTSFIHARHWILGVPVPYTVFIFQAVYRNLKIFASILVVMALAVLWVRPGWSPVQWTIVPALGVYVLTSVWLGAILAPLCARFRDLHHAMQTGMRLMFFVTPILWMPSINEKLALIARYNPFAHFLAVVREPLIYGQLPQESWLWVGTINVIGIPLGLAVYKASRRRIVFWV